MMCIGFDIMEEGLYDKFMINSRSSVYIVGVFFFPANIAKIKRPRNISVSSTVKVGIINL